MPLRSSLPAVEFNGRDLDEVKDILAQKDASSFPEELNPLNQVMGIYLQGQILRHFNIYPFCLHPHSLVYLNSRTGPLEQETVSNLFYLINLWSVWGSTSQCLSSFLFRRSISVTEFNRCAVQGEAEQSPSQSTGCLVRRPCSKSAISWYFTNITLEKSVPLKKGKRQHKNSLGTKAIRCWCQQLDWVLPYHLMHHFPLSSCKHKGSTPTSAYTLLVVKARVLLTHSACRERRLRSTKFSKFPSRWCCSKLLFNSTHPLGGTEGAVCTDTQS